MKKQSGGSETLAAMSVDLFVNEIRTISERNVIAVAFFLLILVPTNVEDQTGKT